MIVDLSRVQGCGKSLGKLTKAILKSYAPCFSLPPVAAGREVRVMAQELGKAGRHGQAALSQQW